MKANSLLIALALTGSLGLWSVAPAAAQVFTNLHSLVFTNGTTPYAGLTLAGNTLYGTAENYGGGTGGGAGSVFKLDADGSNFTNLFIFHSDTNGGNPSGGMVVAGGTLYGTTVFGGASNHGCIFGINTNGTGLTNLFSFPLLQPSSPASTNLQGAYPNTGLILVGSTLYGSSSSGGAFGWGTVFAINTNGSGFTNLHSFALGDGQYPNTPVLSGRTLYGTASGGGDSHVGTIFKLNIDGSGFTNFYSFTQPAYPARTNGDGAFPLGQLILSGSSLYGTASGGGPAGNGTIFTIDTNGMNFTVLYAFSPTNGAGINGDGSHPQAGLILWSNTLYGTAEYGGSFGYGTVFSVNTDGTAFTTLHSFTATNGVIGTNADGAYPLGGLARSGSVLFGTASTGGSAGYGTIFSILFPPPLTIRRAGTNVVVSWPADAVGFNLETTTNLAASAWAPVTVTALTDITNASTGGQKFYRLKHP